MQICIENGVIEMREKRNRMKTCGVVFALILSMTAFAETRRTPLVKYPGEVGQHGWKFRGAEKGKVVYIPFEGYYKSKGGRIEGPVFKLDKKAGENAWYELKFEAKSLEDGYWWVDFFDRTGEQLPDVNSRLYGSKDWRSYEVVVPARPDADSAQIAFVSEKGAFVRDVELRELSVDEAAEWCDKFYKDLPPVDCTRISGESWDLLPKTKSLLRSSKELRIVFLGDSIVNDTWCGNFGPLVFKDFPAAKIKMYVSVRGSTGCWYYHEKKHFEEYVVRYSPDLVVIGGISNYLGPKKSTVRQAEDCMVETIKRCRTIGAEVIVCTPPPSYEFRPDTTSKPFDLSLCEAPLDGRYSALQWDYQRNAAKRTGVQIWDLTTAPADSISRSGKPLMWFKRDEWHNDDRGKQLIARTIAAYFHAAKLCPD